MSEKTTEQAQTVLDYWYMGLLPLEIREKSGIDLDFIIETIETKSK